MISEGAITAIIAGKRVGLKETAKDGVTGVICANITVITGQGFSPTQTCGACVAESACISIITGCRIEFRVLTSIGRPAAVYGAVVSVITGVFIDLPITIVVQTVTCFSRGFRCITCTQTFV
jgi:hypothetical protein